MARAEVFDEDYRVELLEGEVVEMTPIGSRHAGCVNLLTHRLVSGVGDRAVVGVQNPIQVGDLSEPQPDLVLLRPRSDFYAEHHPLPPEVLLVVEVADSSLRYDLGRKAPLYVAAGIPEVWVVDLVDRVVHVTRGDDVLQLRAGGTLAPLAFPDIVLEVAAVLG